MTFTVEGDLALKDMIVRSDFRLVDVEIRAGTLMSPNRVSSLLQRRLAAAAAQRELIENQQLPPGKRPIEGTGGTAPVPVDGALPVVPSSAVPAGVVVSRQVYTVRGSNSPNNVTRGTPIISDGILTRVSGGVTSDSDFGAFDDGIAFLISSVDQVTSVGRLSGDRDLFQLGRGGIPSTFHGIGVNEQLTAVGHSAVDNFNIAFHRSVLAGDRFGVDLNAGGVSQYWATFEVTQFAEQVAGSAYVGERIVESMRQDPAPPSFQPVIMQQSIFAPGGRVVESLGEVNQLLQLGWIIVGNVFPDGIFPT